MLRRMFVAAAAVLALAFIAPGALQSQTLYISAGAAIPSGDDLEDVNTGWILAGGAIFDIGEAGLWAGVDGAYGRHAIDDAVATDETVKPWSIMGVLGYSVPTEGNVDPYVFAGAGIMGASLSDSSIEVDSGFGWQAGGGVSFGGADSSVRPYVEGRFHSASLDATDGIEMAEIDVRIFAAVVGAAISVGN